MYLKLLPPFILIITGTSTSRRVPSILFLLLSFGLSPRIGLLLDLLLPVFLTLGTFCSLRECKVLVCLAALILLARGFFFFFLTRKVYLSPFSVKICHCLSGTLLLEPSFVSMAMFWNYSACVSRFKAHQIVYHSGASTSRQCTDVHLVYVTAAFASAAMVWFAFISKQQRILWNG